MSQNLALELDCSIITNDYFSPLEKVFPNDRFLKLLPDEDFSELSQEDRNKVIYDFGGYPDTRVINVLNAAKSVIIPVVNEDDGIEVAVSSMENIYPYNINIIVVINKTEKGDFKLAKEKIENEIKAKGLDKAYLKFKYFEIKKTRALPNISKTKKSVSKQSIRCLAMHISKLFYNLMN